METNQPQENRKPMSEWVNRLDFTQRDLVIQMYVNGVGISAITRIYQVHHSSVRYHLKKAGVYIKGRYGDVNMKDIERSNKHAALDFYNIKGQKFKVVRIVGRLTDVGWPEHERNFPLSYKDYVQRERNRHSILYKNGIPDIKLKLPDPDHDPDVFRTHKRRSFADIAKQRERIKVPDTRYIRLESTFTE